MFALLEAGFIVEPITKSDENGMAAELALFLPVEWIIGMLVLGPIWFVTRPKLAAPLDPRVIEELDQLMALRDEDSISPEEHKRRVEEVIGGGRSNR